MTLDYSVPGKVTIRMEKYVDKMIEELPEDMIGEVMTPAAEHLFDINESPMYLDDDAAEFFHHMTAKALFLAKRARPDIQTAVSFLCTRVKKPDEDDYKKLARLMKYLQGTKGMSLTIEPENLQVVKWWVDASYAVHHDMKSHTGGFMSMGKGTMYGTSTKQKLNTKSSTEAELVGVDDCMPQILWTRYFLMQQGYNVENKLMQDNQSAIKLEQNGKASSGKRTRHINIRYFFVKDRIERKELFVEYCPTEDMIADYFTKPLQGALFRKFRKMILNHD